MRPSRRNLSSVLTVLMLSACGGAMPGATVQPDRNTGAVISANDFLERGKLHFAAGRYGLAVDAFQQANRAVADNSEILSALAAGYDRLGRFDLSSRYYAKALEFAPQSSTILNNLGYSLMLQGKFAEAVGYLRQAKATTDDAQVAANLALAENRLQAGDQRSAPAQVAAAALPPLPASVIRIAPRDTWIERTTTGVATLITRPQTGLPQAMAKLGVDPGVAHVSRTVPDVAAIPLPAAPPAAVDAAEPAPTLEAAQPAPTPEAAPSETPAAQPIAFGLIPDRPGRAGGSVYSAAIEIAGDALGAGMTDRASAFLRSRGYNNLPLRQNASFGNAAPTTIFFAPGYLSVAQSIAQKLPGQIPLRLSTDLNSAVQIVLGADFLNFESRLPYGALPFDEDVAG